MDPITVLVADNHPTLRRSVIRFLQQYEDITIVGIASSGSATVRQAEDLQPDLILMNLTMKEPTSLETIRCLRAEFPQVKIIVLSLLDSEAYRHSALSAGADDFVSKATLTTDLMSAIRQAVLVG